MAINIDINTEADVKLLVHQFYLKVRKDELLSPIFSKVIKKGNWEMHLNQMCSFWETILLYKRSYTGDPLVKHLPLEISKIHFDRWVLLIENTVDKLFLGDVANEAKRRASAIAKLMMHAKGIEIS